MNENTPEPTTMSRLSTYATPASWQQLHDQINQALDGLRPRLEARDALEWPLTYARADTLTTVKRWMNQIILATPEGKLGAWLSRELGLIQGEGESGAAIAGALADVQGWLAESGTDWAALAEIVSAELTAATGTHSASVRAGQENIPAYARADALRAVQSRMNEFGVPA